jgi:CheY-like chemotaxis protein
MTFTPARHILVVDDEPLLRRLLSELLTDVDYQVDTAEDGAAGWEKLQSQNYDLLVTDNQMPKVSGVELVRKIRAAQMILPIIMVTATPPENIEKLQLAAVLEKPLGINHLVRMVGDVFHQQLQIRNASKLKKIARQLLAAETAAAKSSGKEIRVVFPVYDKLRGPLGRLMGAVGLHSLMTRALTQANGEIHQLDGVQVNADGGLEGLDKLELRSAAASEAMLVSHLLGILVTLIGPALTLQLLHDTWPDLGDLDL